MATTATTRAPIERTEHPHIVKSADTLGGEPRVDGTRIPVRQIVALFEAGTTADEMMASYPPLTRSQIFDAISYAYDHPDEMAFHEERHKIRNIMKAHDLVLIDHRLVPRDRFNPADFPPETPVYTWETLPPELEE
jgi:uncharacterized protein (DUF433 family)